LQISLDLEDGPIKCENEFSDPAYRVVHFVADLPVRIDRYLEEAGIKRPKSAPVIFSLTEFQIVDRETETANEIGPASHDCYKERQRQAVERRLKLGLARRRNDL